MFYNRFLQSVERWPSAVAVEIQRQKTADAPAPPVEQYTYAELRRMAESIGRWLFDNGHERGERGAILAANSPRWVAAYLGIVASGNTAVPLDTAFHSDQVAKLLLDSGATLIFTDEKHFPIATDALALIAADRPEVRIRIALLDTRVEKAACVEDMFLAGPGTFSPAAISADDVVCVLYTSGTTSDPKGVMLTDGNLSAEIEAVSHYIPISPADTILGILPLFHSLSQMANIMLPFAAGARVVYLDSLNTTELLRALQERNITLFCCVPQFFYLIHERIFTKVKDRGPWAFRAFKIMMALTRASRRMGLNLGKVFFHQAHKMLGPKMRYFVTGGSRFDPSIGNDFHSLGFTVLQAYGLTEASGGAFGTPPNDNVMGSIGYPFHGQEAKIHEPKLADDGSGHQIGEICIRGPIVMKGYYNRPEATAEIVRDGWLHSGDLAYIDERGNYFITGRAKEVIVLSSGKNVYPEEIESYYLKSPWIKEICVLGLAGKPGEPFSERLHGVIVPNFELLRQKKIVNTREVIRFDIEGISSHLAPTKRILSYDIWQEDLPRTTTRKLKRFTIEKLVKEQQDRPQEDAQSLTRPLTEEDRAWMHIPTVARALDAIRAASKVPKPELHPRDNLELDLGLDSMERVELLVALEHLLGANVEDSTASDVYTVRELVDLVRDNMGKATAGEGGWDSVLHGEETNPEVLALRKNRVVAAAFWFLAGRLLFLFSRFRFKLKISGLENLPKSAPFILSPNHQSFLDAPIFAATLPWYVFRDLFFVGTSEIFGEGLRRQLAKSIRVIPVDPDANLVPAMRAGAFGLGIGRILMLYPEGERSIDGTPKTFKKGAAILAHHLNVPIVPVAQEGFHQAWPRGKKFQRFAPLEIRIGKPIYPDPNLSPEQSYDRLTTELKTRVVTMWEAMHEARAAKKELVEV